MLLLLLPTGSPPSLSQSFFPRYLRIYTPLLLSSLPTLVPLSVPFAVSAAFRSDEVEDATRRDSFLPGEARVHRPSCFPSGVSRSLDMISPPVQLAPDAAIPSTSPQKVSRPPVSSPASSMRPPSSTTRIPLSELTTLRPPTSEAQLLPDGGRGSPVKGACTTFHHPPPPTFSANDIQQHISSIQKTQKKKRQSVLITPGTSPAQPEFSPVSPSLAHDSAEISDVELPLDDGSKPAYSYATLIGMAILRAPDRKLTLSAIYNWISSTFAYYSQSEAGWQNSIRHNLSLNKAFVKVERPKDQPGKGHYWTVETGCEGQFLKTRVAKKLTQSGKLTNTVKKDGKKRHVEFEDIPKMKRIMISPIETALQYRKPGQAPASPPPTEDKRKRNSLWDYDDSGYFSPSTNTLMEEDDVTPFEDFPSRSEIYSKEFSYSANALDLVLSPPPSSSPMRQDKIGVLGPRTPALPPRKTIMASPGTSLREHRQHMLQMLTSPDTEAFPLEHEDDPWLTDTPKPKERSGSILESPWDDAAERAAFGSPDKRESRRRESRRSLVCGMHAQELYETGFESSNMPGVNVLDIMRREVEKVKGANRLLRPSMMERSQSSLF